MMIGRRIIKLAEVDSTNRFLMDWIMKERPEEGTIVVTNYQTAGKGLDKNTWESMPGQNLTMSFVIYPGFLPVDHQFSLNKAVSLGVSDFVRNALDVPGELKIKWPNDIYFDHRKLAGILIQNGIIGNFFDFSVIGIGININQENFDQYPVSPVSFKMITGKDYPLDRLLDELLDCLYVRLNQLKERSVGILDEDYLSCLYRYNEINDFKYRRKIIRAKITGVNRYGQLMLEIPGGKMLECDLKEVALLNPKH
jgi:BirA family transcriptional regulator, biotin operon repressor / biotin---[acetyl-CoA-carboxylase] ligase